MTATHNHDNPQLITCATKIRKRRQFVASYQNIPQLLFGCHLDITFAQHYPASAVLQLKEINVLVTYFCYFQQYPVLLFSFSIPFFRLTFLSHFDFLSCEIKTLTSEVPKNSVGNEIKVLFILVFRDLL